MAIDPITWLIDKILQARDARTEIKVLVHEACFTDDPTRTPYYFVKVVNQSPEVNFTITHIYAKDGSREIEILNPNRRLPHTLARTEIWETWLAKNMIHDHNKIFKNVFVVLTNGKQYRSKKNKSVRPAGFVGG